MYNFISSNISVKFSLSNAEFLGMTIIVQNIKQLCPIFQVFPENHLGRIYYSVNYDSTSESLTVKLQRIRNLPKSTPEAGKTNKTYIK